jgi:citrate lyase subunit beta / citryl-CoA lyase
VDSRVIRSYLFVPANRPERFAKACAAGADAVIVDLEDAVPAPEKVSARKALSEWLSSGGSAMIRINGATSAYFAEDLRLAAFPTVQGIVLPKAEDPDEVRGVSKRAGNPLPVLPLIESARGFANALAIAKAPNVQRLMFGSIDFQLDMGISGDQEELLYFRSNLVLVSRLADIQAPVDGVTTSIDNLELVRADGVRGKRLGFGGKLCIHPKQVAVVNECFEPSAEEVAWAKRIVTGASAASGGAVSVDGTMVDRPILARAEAILARLGEQQNPGQNRS